MIFRTPNPCTYNRNIFRNLVHLEPDVSLEACQTCHVIRHIQRAGIVRTVYSSTFKDFQGYSGILMYIQPHSQARNYRRIGEASLIFFENRKKVPCFFKKGLDCVHLGVKFSMENVIVSRKKKRQNVSLCGLFFLWFLTKCLSKCPSSTKPFPIQNIFWLHNCTQTLFFLQNAPS